MRLLRLAPALLALSLATCTEDAPILDFGSDFTFGAAIAGFQVDMGCPTIAADKCEDRHSDWYQWITDPRITENPEAVYLKGGPPSTGPGFFELYPQDLERAKNELKLGAVRLSIEWSRIFPTSTVGVQGHEALKAIASADGIAFYKAQFAKMKALGLKPLVTLTHYTLPVWIHDGVGCHFDFAHCTARGWLDAGTIDEIAKYSGFVAKEFGADIDDWATQNEPLAITLAGYMSPGPDRTNPPGLTAKAAEAKAVTIAMIIGHARMYDAVKAADTVDADGDGKASRVGLVFNLVSVRPLDENDVDDDTGAKNIEYLYNELYLNATIKGYLDENVDGGLALVRDDLKGRMDYLGVNYYTRLTIDGTATSILPGFSKLLTMNVVSSVFWENYPKGLYDVLKWAHDKYDLPMIVTENGYSTTPTVTEADRERLMMETLQWALKARQEGVNLQGYFWWTLMDNYEWNHGMSGTWKMGLYEVDPADPQKKRVLREFAKTYAKIAETKLISSDVAAKYPIR